MHTRGDDKRSNIKSIITRAERGARVEATSSGRGRAQAYPRELYECLIYRYTILDVEATLFRDGMQLPCSSHRLPKGLIEDFLLYTMNVHPILRCVFAAKGGPVGGYEYAQFFLMQSALSFSLSVVIDPLIRSLVLDVGTSQLLVTLCNVLGIMPITLIIVSSVFASIADALSPKFMINHPFLSKLFFDTCHIILFFQSLFVVIHRYTIKAVRSPSILV